MTLELIHDYELADDERGLIAKLSGRLQEHARKNKLKWAYYEGKNALKDLHIALPAVASSIRAVVGWPEIVVDSLAERLEWQGWISPKADISELDRVFAENDLASEFAKATLESLVTGMGFLEVSAGGDGEPTIIIDAVTAGEATYMWDDRLNRGKGDHLRQTRLGQVRPDPYPEPVSRRERRGCFGNHHGHRILHRPWCENGARHGVQP